MRLNTRTLIFCNQSGANVARSSILILDWLILGRLEDNTASQTRARVASFQALISCWSSTSTQVVSFLMNLETIWNSVWTQITHQRWGRMIAWQVKIKNVCMGATAPSVGGRVRHICSMIHTLQNIFIQLRRIRLYHPFEVTASYFCSC